MWGRQVGLQGRSASGRAKAAIALALGLMSTQPNSPAMAADLHDFWDSRCSSCHRHAGEFARNHLRIKDGLLVGRKPGRDVCAFLVDHGAGQELAAQVCKMLTAQTATPSLFKDKCASCHGTAADLSRTGLVAGNGGTLKTQNGGRDLSELLATHGKLEPGEAAALVETLRRVYSEVHDAGK